MSLLETVSLLKQFGPHVALSSVSIDIKAGEVHALVGENGAGKSTFIKMITGVYAPDGGEIRWENQQVSIGHPRHARDLGINVLHQDRQLVPTFTGYENLFLGQHYPTDWGRAKINWREMKQKGDRLKAEFGIELDLNKTAQQMSPPERTMLEILRAMMLTCKLFILDEPTASLTDHEAELLFALIDRLKAQGTAILYVSHRMDEIFRLSDRITVLRNGQKVATTQTRETTKDQLISLMTDGQMKQHGAEKRKLRQGQVIMQVADVRTADGRVKKADVVVREGEIVGIFGLAGAGRTELLEAIYGVRPLSGGSIQLNDKTISAPTPAASIREGVVLIPEDRRHDALIMGMTIRENMTLPVIGKYAKWFGLAEKQEKQEVRGWMEAMKVKAVGSEQTVSQLSGGNQQKVVFAKALLSNPRLFLCDEPTQAVDVMTRSEIHNLLRAKAEEGCGVVYVSSDLQEVLEVADRIVVMHDGKTIASVENDGVTAEQILHLCYRPENAATTD
ncbi:sugar ABC transporter ATP-binding protein [Brevibacillus fluminis]|uniref:sugar ABC transporter ATP-binding protein n=1 Tax=Brevibacillus fluminis TaxID=511487 RepID=UPI003F8BC41D